MAVEIAKITLGNRARITFELDIGGVPADPDELTLIARNDREILGPFVLTDPELVKDSVGRYHADLVPTVAGRYRYRYSALDALAAPLAATEGEFLMLSVLEGR